MAFETRKFAAATLAAAAALSLAATPAEARGWNRWDGRDRVDAGDVIAGVLVLGTIAAIASAARTGSRDRYDPRYPDGRDTSYRGDAGRYATPGSYDRGSSSGIDRAVDMCVAEVERSRDRVGAVDSAARDRDGWAVSGELAGGQRFSCRIGNDGRIVGTDLDGYRGAEAPAEDWNGDYRGAEAPADDRQYDDDVYAAARARQGDGPPPLPDSDPYAENDYRGG